VRRTLLLIARRLRRRLRRRRGYVGLVCGEREAALPHCTAHGLRKAAAARLAELGAGESEIMAVTGHTTSKEVTRYTRGARQKVLATKAMARFDEDQKSNKTVPLSSAQEGGGTIPASK
jgi:integrase